MGLWGLLLSHTLSQWSACFTFPCLSCVFLLRSVLFHSWRRPPQTLASSSQPSSSPTLMGTSLHNNRASNDWCLELASEPSKFTAYSPLCVSVPFLVTSSFTIFFSSAMPHHFLFYFICHCLCFRTELWLGLNLQSHLDKKCLRYYLSFRQCLPSCRWY